MEMKVESDEDKLNIKEEAEELLEVQPEIFYDIKTESYDLPTKNNKTHECPECGTRFTQSVTLEHHRVTKHNVEGTKNIVCQCCGDVFKTYLSYKNHKRNNKPKEPVDCTVCGKTLDNKAKLYTHMRNTHPTETFTCEYCGKVVKTKNALKNHQILACPKNPIKDKPKSQGNDFCELCSSNVENRRLHILKEHVKTVEVNGIDMFQCCFCDQSFGRKSSISHHLLLHTGKPIYRCEVCSIEYKEKRSLTKHLEISHGIEPTNKREVSTNGLYSCNQCEYKTTAKNQFTRHLLVHGSKQYKCDLCNFATVHKSNLTIHKGKVHDNKFNEPAKHGYDKINSVNGTVSWDSQNVINSEPSMETNTNKIKDSYDREEHIEQMDPFLDIKEEISSSDGDEIDDSKIDNIQSKSEQLLRFKTEEDEQNNAIFPLHFLDYSHNGNEEDSEDTATISNDKKQKKKTRKSAYPCQECNQIFDSAKKLSDHKHYYHKHEEVKCDQCEKTFDCKRKMLKHKNRFHSDAAQCEECGKEFKLRYLLRRHVLMYHKNEIGSFPCEACGLIFDRKDKVQRHQQSKHNKRTCELCGESFEEMKHLIVHRSRQHGIEAKEFLCEICNQYYDNVAVHHFRTHRVMRSPCLVCGKVINSEARLQKHIRNSHKDVPAPATRELVIAALKYNGIPEELWPGEDVNIMQFCLSSGYGGIMPPKSSVKVKLG